MSKVTIVDLENFKQTGEKMTCLTAYDATFGFQLADAGIDMTLVGDSLGMVIQGQDSTVPVTMDDMVYHTRQVATGSARAERQPLLIADMPYMSYATPGQTYQNAARLMQAGAQMVKLEGGEWLDTTIVGLTARGIPVCGHLGLTPQSAAALGGYRVQGKDSDSAKRIIADAQQLVESGIRLLVLECVPRDLAATITAQIAVPVIGIGAGPDTDAQVLVLYDLLGITPGFKAKFVRNFMQDSDDIQAALRRYVRAVKTQEFPAEGHCFHR